MPTPEEIARLAEIVKQLGGEQEEDFLHSSLADISSDKPREGDEDSLLRSEKESKEIELDKELLSFKVQDTASPKAIAPSSERAKGVGRSFLSENEFQALQRTLKKLPLNLKMSVEEIIGVKTYDATSLSRLIQLLIDGASTKVIHHEVDVLSKQKEGLPKKKLKGASFLRKQAGFLNQFRTRTWPAFRWYLAAFLAIWGLFLLGFLFLFRPIRSYIFYREGLRLISSDQYLQANRLFEQAFFGKPLGKWEIRGWPSESWMLTYAQAYQKRRQFSEAERKYVQLLGFVPETRQNRHLKSPLYGAYPRSMEGYIAYAKMLSEYKGDYEGAHQILLAALIKEPHNHDILLATGANLTKWGRYQPEKLTRARYFFDLGVDSGKAGDAFLFHLLEVALYTEDEQQIFSLWKILKSRKVPKTSKKLASSVLAKLGLYMLQVNRPTEAKDILFKAVRLHPTNPQAHYGLGVYFDRTFASIEEDLALRKALHHFRELPFLAPERMKYLIETQRRDALLLKRDEKFFRGAQRLYRALALHEQGRRRHWLPLSPMAGAAYRDLGDFFYDRDVYSISLVQYKEAEKNHFLPATTEYHMGFILYAQKALVDAQERFYNVDQRHPLKNNTQFALANTLLKRGSYHGAESFYTLLIENLQKEQGELDSTLFPQSDPTHKAIAEGFLKGYNNLGATSAHIARAQGTPGRASRSLLYFTKALEYADLLSRSPEGKRSSESNLPSLNLKRLLNQERASLLIFDEIPKEPEFQRMGLGGNER